MENPWLAVEDEEIAENGNTFFGVFNKSPVEIARSLPRPQNPCCHQFHPMTYHQKSISTGFSYNESPVASPVGSLRLTQQYISVF